MSKEIAEIHVFDFDGTLTDNTHRLGLPIQQYLSAEELKKDGLYEEVATQFALVEQRARKNENVKLWIVTAREDATVVAPFLESKKVSTEKCSIQGRPLDLFKEDEPYSPQRVREWKADFVEYLVYQLRLTASVVKVTVWEDSRSQIEVIEQQLEDGFGRTFGQEVRLQKYLVAQGTIYDLTANKGL
jgi:hypothetical protein